MQEGIDLEFRGEFFNLFNRVNFAQPDVDAITSASGVRNAAAGNIRNTATAWQVQLGLKLTF